MSLKQLQIITTAQMRAIDDASAAAGIPPITLMTAAGQAVADAMAERFAPAKLVVICGPGNNGGDGWVAASALARRGWPVSVLSLVPRQSLAGPAIEAAAGWSGEILPPDTVPDAELYLDAMYGAGLARPLEGPAAALAEHMAGRRDCVLAVDVPSGVNADSGSPVSGPCVRAALTVTFVRKRPAHLLYPARAFCGDIILADIGAPDSVVDAQTISLWENAPALWRVHFPWPRFDAHKHARGHVHVASGGHARTGAARLAAQAALRVGAGLATVLSPPDALAENAAQLTAIMLHAVDTPEDYVNAALRAQCMLIGPGFGLESVHKQRLNAVLHAPARAPLVLDADALTLLAGASPALQPGDVLTPHVGEFERLCPGLLARAPSKIDAARIAAREFGCVLLLKGPDTVIAAPNGDAAVNTTGTPFLATAGSGDVLAGLIAGLIAQGMGAFHAAAAAAWLHGRCGEGVGAGLVAEDLHKCLPSVLNDLAPAGLRPRML